MSSKVNQKSKILYLAKILYKGTSDEFGLTMHDLIQKLKEYGFVVDRRTVYDDLRNLSEFGIDIISDKRGRQTYYYVGNRILELSELKLLVDTIHAANFITEKKTRKLIKKLEVFASDDQCKELNRQVYVTGKVKSMNEGIFYNVDNIYYAINENKQIKFKYFRWNEKKERELRNQGHDYIVSPGSLCWNLGRYYLIGFDEVSKTLKHFRVDKMLEISAIEKTRKHAIFTTEDLYGYSQKHFGMFGGDEKEVQLKFHNRHSNSVIDQFGLDILLIPFDSDYFTVRVKVALNKQFISWVLSFSPDAMILDPPDAVELLHQVINETKKLYE